MVSTGSNLNAQIILDDLFALKKFKGPHSKILRGLTHERAREILNHPDMRYMPEFKILDLLSAMVNIATDIIDASQLRVPEARVALREALSDSTPLIRLFMLDVALERARYAPMMLSFKATDAAGERQHHLEERWAAMREVHEANVELPTHWIEAIDDAVARAIAAPHFKTFREGPLLQLFSEMLAVSRLLQHEGKDLYELEAALSEDGALWKRYALKPKRYGEKASYPTALAQWTPPPNSLQ